MEELGVTLQGQSFPHLIYHFVPTYSNWEAGTVCYSESFESLCGGLQNAVWELGKVPQLHRTDRLSTAVSNTTNPAEFTERYQGLRRYYGLEGEKTQAGHGNENGDVEQRHHRFKRAVAQELLLRGSRDFGSMEEYERFLQAMFVRLNAGRKRRLTEEMAVMKELPERRMESCKRERVKVDSGSLIYVDRNVYSVPSRWRRGCTWTRWKSGTARRRSGRCRGCGGGESIVSIIATSSTGWCASRERSSTTVTARSCFPAADSAWRSICCKKSWDAPQAAKSTCGFWSWRPSRARSKWTRLCASCWWKPK